MKERCPRFAPLNTSQNAFPLKGQQAVCFQVHLRARAPLGSTPSVSFLIVCGAGPLEILQVSLRLLSTLQSSMICLEFLQIRPLLLVSWRLCRFPVGPAEVTAAPQH